jgi:ribosomal RNA assembly protein
MRLLRIPEERASLLLKNQERDLKTIENLLKIEISASKKGEIEISCPDPLEELRAYEIVKAYGRGFALKNALKLLEDNSSIQIIEIKDFANTKNSSTRLKGRVIGKNGRIKSFLENELDLCISIYGKTISLIGNCSNLTVGRQVIELLLNGGSYAAMRKLIKINSEKLR